MSFRSLLLCIFVSAATLFMVWSVMLGIQAVIIDTGRAMAHPYPYE